MLITPAASELTNYQLHKDLQYTLLAADNTRPPTVKLAVFHIR